MSAGRSGLTVVTAISGLLRAVERRRGLGRGADEDDPAARAGNGALDEQQSLLGVDGVDGEVLGGLAHAAHPAGHPHTLEHPTGGRAAADGTRLAVVAVGAV